MMKRDKPVAKVEAATTTETSSFFGILKGQAEIKGDVLEPIDEQWDAEQ